ncbi:MAG: hypothetical protein WC980_09505 [Candidatus Brocadiia bacterium]
MSNLKVLFLLFIIFSILDKALAADPAPQPPPPPPPPKISSTDWENKYVAFRSKYQSKNPAERVKAVQLLNPLWGFFDKDRDRRQAVQTIIQTLNSENDQIVIDAIFDCITKMTSTDYYAAQWFTKDYSLVNNESGKLKLIQVLGQFINYQAEAANILAEMAKNDESSPAIKKTIISALSKFPGYLSCFPLVNLSADRNQDIAWAALSVLSQIKNVKSISLLIELLPDENRKIIKDKIGQTLETITGQKYGIDAKKWQKWWQIPPETPQTDIAAAINRGKDFLIKQAQSQGKISDELTFYALLHSGLPINDPMIEASLNNFMTKKLERTYNVAILAMALAYIDRGKYQSRIAQCAHFLMANQSYSGNWTYGATIDDSTITQTVTSDALKPVITGKDKPNNSTLSVKKIRVKVAYRRKDAAYDNSNTQYALLGLRACAEADIDIPQEVWADAEKHLLRTQSGDGGWCYTIGSSYGSMTAGGLGGLAISKYYQNKKLKDDPAIKKSVDWLDKNFTVLENPCMAGAPTTWHYYYIYGLQRAGVLSDTETFGEHNWYQSGARYLLIEQRESGDWNNNAQDTAFAMLFLSRATKPLTPIKYIETPK